MRHRPGGGEPAPGPGGLTVAARSYDAERRSHRHGFVQVLLPERGRLRLLIEGESGVVDAARLAVVPAGAEHTYWADGPGANRVLVADLPAGMVPEAREERAAPDRLAPPGPFLAMGPRFGLLAAALRSELDGGGLGDPLVADALGRYLAAAVLGRPTAPASERGAVSPAARRLARRTEAFLRLHAADPLTIAEVAAAVGASPSHLQRAFRAETGGTIVAYVHRLRLERARALLGESELSVLEVAAAVGFASPSHLARLFQRHLGLSPSRYRALAASPERAGSDVSSR